MKLYRPLGISSALLAIIADRLSKLWALQHATSPRFYTSWCTFVIAHNPGIAWSIGEAHTATGNIALVAIVGTITALCSIWFMYAWLHNKPYTIALGLLMGGAVSNFYDRCIYGAVIDFIWLHYATFSWPIFNIADCCICLGGCLWWLSAIQEHA